ncbi:MAG: hypothetical protein GKR94_33830 [Gammaproteobacteria bacterium]|nr:hypothetical protein [Gammaproteobacteria bacterium]
MGQKYDVLILGASYGSLFAAKLLLAGHNAKLVCLPAEADLINEQGIRVRIPVRGSKDTVALDSATLSGSLSAGGPADVDPGAFDLVVLAMQEPQYRANTVRELLDAVARSGPPCMSIMNMPPLPFLRRIASLAPAELAHCYTDATVWDSFNPDRFTLASPDPQAFRPPEEPLNVLQVSLPTNFKVARFASDADTQILRTLQRDIEGANFQGPDGPLEIPVKLKVHESVYVPLAKWCMLLAGNYRCVGATQMRSIRDAVHADLDESTAVYDWVAELCRELGADPADQVPFEKYAQAAEGLSKPSSAARALANGATHIERVDKVVKTIAEGRGKKLPALDRIVETVDSWLARNRAA